MTNTQQELATVTETSPAVAEQSPLATLLADPDRLKDFPVETVERLFNMDRQLRSDQAQREYIDAMHQVQSKLEPVRKAVKNTQTGSFYASAEQVDKMLNPILVDHGITCSSWTEEGDKEHHVLIVLQLSHVGGHRERHTFPAPIDNKGMKGSATKTELHGIASSMTYAVRHLKCQVFNIQLVQDDDGNRGGAVGPAAAKISTEQEANLLALITEVRADQKRFLTFFGVNQVGDLAAGRYREAVRMLEAKR